MKIKIQIALIATTLLVALGALAQTSPPASSPIYNSLQQVFDLNDTNSLVNAREINVAPVLKWNSAQSRAGGGLNLDWWVSDQQGAFFGFEEYTSRESYFSLGYQARTVFKGFEAALGLGTRQSNDAALGDVKMFLRPTLTKQLYAGKDWDVRLTLGADVFNAGKPNPFLGIQFKAFKW